MFFDLGGNSLTASELVDAAEKRGLQFTIEDLFNNPHLQSLAALATTAPSDSRGTSSSSKLHTESDVSDGLYQSFSTTTSLNLLASNSTHLTSRQKQLMLAHSRRKLRDVCTWRRAKLNIEVPLARIKRAFDDIVEVQLACRATLLDYEDNMVYASDRDYRFQHTLYCDLDTDAIQKLEKNALNSISLQSGPVFSVDLYRTQRGLNLFLAASALLFDEYSWRIILDHLDSELSGKRRASQSLCRQSMGLMQMPVSTQDSESLQLATVDLSNTEGDFVDFWGLSWVENRPNSLVWLGLKQAQERAQSLDTLDIEDAAIHVLHSFGSHFGRRNAVIIVEKIRPHGQENEVGNFQETPLRVSWANEVGRSRKYDESHWGILKQNIRRKLYDVYWAAFPTDSASHTGALTSPDLVIYISKESVGPRTEREYSAVFDVQGSWDRPGDHDNTWYDGFVQVHLSCSATGALEAVCTFDNRNKQAEALESWARNLGEDGDIRAPLPVHDHGREQQYTTNIAQVCGVKVDQIENIYSCTPMQESLTFAVGEDASPYMMQLVFRRTEHTADLDGFKRAWEETARANAILRTRICQVQGQGTGSDRCVQVVLDESVRWYHAAGQGLHEYLDRDARKPMKPGDSSFRYALVEERSNIQEASTPSQFFVWTAYHALCDGASILTILDEVSRRAHGETPPAREPFETFVRSPAVRPDPEKERSFWQKTLSELNPTPYPQTLLATDSGAVPAATLKQTLTLGNLPAYGITKALFLRAVWALLMSHYTGTEDVCFGAVNGGRMAAVPGVARMAGPTINVTPVAFHIDTQDTVASFLRRFRAQAAEMMAFEHSGVSRIRRFLEGNHNSATDFRTLVVVHPENWDDALQASSTRLGLEYLTATGKKEQHPYPLVLSFTMSTSEAIDLLVQYDERVISCAEAETLVHHFQALLTVLAGAGPDVSLASVDPLSDYDLAQIARWNASTPPVEATCVDRLFRSRVLEQPHAVAVCSLEQSLTYNDVEFYSSLLAARLLELNVQPGEFIGACFDKSVWTVVAILAIFKLGAVYVPIDPGHPLGRIMEVAATVELRVAMASLAGAKVLEGICSDVVMVDNHSLCSVARSAGAQEFPSRSTPSSIAYLLFTSGSTGKPKGILISHDAICTSIKHHGIAFGAGPHWRTFQFCAHTFDMSIGEFLTTLAHGGCICVPSEEDRMNDLAGAITALRANTLLVVPTVANLLHPEDVPTLGTLVLGGEPVTRETVKRWAPHVNLTCSYGPSETSVWCAANLRVCPDAHPANIGRNIGGTMWIVRPDNCQRLSAVGCVGEVLISGGIVGRGYFADEATTAASFVPAPDWLKSLDPASASMSGGRVYKSGDLARYNPDGTLSIVGRLHTQVKLRGFRVELGEIENQIMTTGAVTAALAALPSLGPCANQIIAVVSSAPQGLGSSQGGISLDQGDQRPLTDALVSHLQATVPDYMVPTAWVVVTHMPLLISGKVDRKMIQTWIEAMDEATYNKLTRQTDEIEGLADEAGPGSVTAKLRDLWAEVLAVEPDRIGLRKSFQSLGGDSLAAMKVASRAKALGLPVSVRSMISNGSSLGSLTAQVEKSMSMDMADAVAEGGEIDWRAETMMQLPLSFGVTQTLDEGQKGPSLGNKRGAIVLLTGVMGFFG